MPKIDPKSEEDTPTAADQWDNDEMNDSQPISPRRRMQELLAIPDSQRTDEQWDELHELEIQLSPINRDPSAEKEGRRKRSGPPPNPRPGNNPAGSGQPRKPFKKFHKKTPKAPPASS